MVIIFDEPVWKMDTNISKITGGMSLWKFIYEGQGGRDCPSKKCKYILQKISTYIYYMCTWTIKTSKDFLFNVLAAFCDRSAAVRGVITQASPNVGKISQTLEKYHFIAFWVGQLKLRMDLIPVYFFQIIMVNDYRNFQYI